MFETLFTYSRVLRRHRERPLADATAVPKMPVDGRCEDVIFFDGVFFESSLTSIFFAP